jgi:hypothetical protein
MRFGRTAAGRGAELPSPARMVTAPPEPGLAPIVRTRGSSTTASTSGQVPTADGGVGSSTLGSTGRSSVSSEPSETDRSGRSPYCARIRLIAETTAGTSKAEAGAAGTSARAVSREPRAGIVADPDLVREAKPRVSLEQVAQAIDRFLADGVHALDPELDAALARRAAKLEHGRVDVRLLAQEIGYQPRRRHAGNQRVHDPSLPAIHQPACRLVAHARAREAGLDALSSLLVRDHQIPGIREI